MFGIVRMILEFVDKKYKIIDSQRDINEAFDIFIDPLEFPID